MKIIYSDSSKWLLVFCKNGISDSFARLLRNTYRVDSITVVLKDYDA